MRYAIFVFLICTLYYVICIPPPHPLVVAARQEEQFLPANLRSPALHNPHLRELLPLTSLLHSGEQLVYERDTDTVPRKEIYNLLTHAGLLPRKRFQQRPAVIHHQRIPSGVNFHDPPIFPSPEYLQHL